MLRYIEEQNKPASVWRGWMSHNPGGRQVHPNQTKTVKGQNDKTVATAGAIKRVLPCPVEEVEKQSIFSGVKGKTEQEEKKKDKKENRKRKERKTKKKESWFNRACIHRSVSLSPPSNLTFFQNANKDPLSFGQQPFRSDSLKVNNPHGRILFLGGYLH